MFSAKSSLRSRRPFAKTLKLVVWAFSLNFLHDSTLFVIDIHQNVPISLILTPFDHFQIRLTFAVTPNLILEPCHIQTLQMQSQEGTLSHWLWYYFLFGNTLRMLMDTGHWSYTIDDWTLSHFVFFNYIFKNSTGDGVCHTILHDMNSFLTKVLSH